ncbi:MAG: glycosyltransferase [Fuerstiella sp.]
MKPSVSVVLPVFNAAATISRSIRSVLHQTLSDIELIVVNDGSTDETPEIVRRCRDRRLKMVELPHLGVAAAANKGTRLAQADVIARMDADDVAHPTKLEQQLQLMRSADFDVVGCRVNIIDGAGTAVPGLQRYERWINEETLTPARIRARRFVEFPLVNPTILARRSYFSHEFRSNGFPEDYDLMLRAAQAGMSFGKVDQVLFDWIDSAGRLTRRDARYSTQAFMQCRRHYLLTGPLHGISRVDLWGAGQTGKPWLRWLQARGITVRQIFEVNRRKIGQRIHDVPVVDVAAMGSADGVPLFIAVGAAGARSMIEAHIAERDYVEGTDAWFVA